MARRHGSSLAPSAWRRSPLIGLLRAISLQLGLHVDPQDEERLVANAAGVSMPSRSLERRLAALRDRALQLRPEAIGCQGVGLDSIEPDGPSVLG
jgi:hypothetical protein